MTNIGNDRAAYRILAIHGFYAEDHLYQEGEEIYFDGEPNEEMEPLNELAHQRLTTYLEKLDDLARKTAEKFGRAFVGRPRSLDGAIAIATEDERRRTAIMGTHNIDGTRPDVDRKIDKIEREEVPETPKKKVGRPRKVDTLHVA